jgi:hypothetical protein
LEKAVLSLVVKKLGNIAYNLQSALFSLTNTFNSLTR